MDDPDLGLVSNLRRNKNVTLINDSRVLDVLDIDLCVEDIDVAEDGPGGPLAHVQTGYLCPNFSRRQTWDLRTASNPRKRVFWGVLRRLSVWIVHTLSAWETC